MSRRPHRSAPTLRGFTLVEIMVAVTIGLIILAAVAQIFATSRASYGLQEDLARLQESGRFSMEFVTRDLRMAGYAGCVNVNRDLNPDLSDNPVVTVRNNLNNAGDEARSFGAGLHIQGYDYAGGGNWNPLLPGFLAGQVNTDTDVVIIRRAAEQASTLETSMAATNADLDLPDINELGLSANDIVLVSDCVNVDVFQLSDNLQAGGAVRHAQGLAPNGNQTGDLTKQYDADAQVRKLVTRAYFIGTTAAGSPALMRVQMEDGAMVNPPQELVEDVENMQLLYGVDSDGDGNADRYLVASTVGADWPRVVSVRVGLLVRTSDELGADPDTNSYNVVDANIDPTPGTNDRRQRRVFSSTVQLRNTI